MTLEKGAVIDGQNSYDPQGEEHYRGVHGISAHKSCGLEFRDYPWMLIHMACGPPFLI